MKSKAFLALAAMGIALMLPLMAAADEPDPLVLTVTGAGYYENVTAYEWDAEATVTSGGTAITAVNLVAGGQIVLDYNLAATRVVEDAGFIHGFRGSVVVENNTAGELTAMELVLNLFVREGEEPWEDTEYEIRLPVDVDESTTVPYDFEIDIEDFIALDQDTMEFKVVASMVLDDETYDQEAAELTVPAVFAILEVNRAALIDADFVWLQAGLEELLPAWVNFTTDLSMPWLLDTADLTNGAADLNLEATIGVSALANEPGAHEFDLKLEVQITPSDDVAALIDPLLLPVNITVPATGSHSVHFYVTGGHGSVAAWMGTSELHLGATIAAGSQLSFVATPEAGYKVKQWTINNVVQNGKGLVMNIQYLAVNTVVTVEFAPVDAMTEDDDEDEEEDGNPAAPAVANMILKQHNIPHRIATTTLKKNGKATYINLISAVAKQNDGTSFMGVDRTNQTAFYNAVYNYLKQLGAQLP